MLKVFSLSSWFILVALNFNHGKRVLGVSSTKSRCKFRTKIRNSTSIHGLKTWSQQQTHLI